MRTEPHHDRPHGTTAEQQPSAPRDPEVNGRPCKDDAAQDEPEEKR